jgi:hypothetical protein
MVNGRLGPVLTVGQPDPYPKIEAQNPTAIRFDLIQCFIP